MGMMNKNAVRYAASIGLALLLMVTVAFGFSIPGLGRFEKVKPVNGVVTIPVAKVSDGKAHYFRLVNGGRDLNFFIVKGSDGVIHTAFDACDVCYREKKGYVQQGDQMICRNCNQKFGIGRLSAGSNGGCNPAHLPARVDAATVRISVADLMTGARFF